MLELSIIEQHLLHENSALAMNLMVLEAKIRERFRTMEQSAFNLPDFDDSLENDISLADIKALIPQDIITSSIADSEKSRRNKKRLLETIGMAAVLAIITALGVFGLASILQLTLTWLA